MIKRIRNYAPWAFLLALTLIVSGCSAGQQVSAADVVAKMRDTMKNVQSSEGTVDVSVNINKDGIKGLAQSFMGKSDTSGLDRIDKLPDTASVTLQTWRQSPDKMRVEVQSSSLPGVRGATLVYDGAKFYAYDPTHNTVYSGTPSNMIDKLPAQAKAFVQNMDMDQMVDKVLDATNITLAGSEKVGGIDTYKLEMTPKPDAADRLGLPQMVQMQAGVIIKDLHATVWVDQARWVPLRVTLDHPSIGQLNVTVSKLELNKTVDPSRFVLQVPSGAKTVDLDAKVEQNAPKSTTLADARSQATKDGWKLLEPAYVPTGATLVEVLNVRDSKTGGAGFGNVASSIESGFVLNYSSPTTSFGIVEGKSKYDWRAAKALLGGMGKSIAGMKEVTVRGNEAMAFSTEADKVTALLWQEKDSGTWVAVHGKLTLDEAQKIAESLR